MTGEPATGLAIRVLAGFIGFAVVGKVPSTLRAPVLAGTTAIHGIVVVGGIAVLGSLPDPSVLDAVILVVAIALGAFNAVAGFLVTDRMLAAFKPRTPPAPGRERR